MRAQESRRILDRLYGYTLSPLLWKKVQTGLSAGRVQSVAVRLIVEREEERRAFNAAVYWDLEARLKGEGREFIATLVRLGDQRIATGKDFDPQTGALKNQNARLLGEEETTALVETIRANVPWTVTSVEQKPGVERPAPPFTTSTLTQEASRKLGFSAERTMQVAQRLFQGVEVGDDQMEGLITLSPHRLDDAVGQGVERIGARDSRDVRRRVLRQSAPLPDARQERAGSARGDSSHRLPARAESARERCSTPTASGSTT